MGMYTEVLVNVDLKPDTPEDVLSVLRAMCARDHDSPALIDRPHRWSHLFCNGSYYTPSTSCANLTFDDISRRWSLLGKGDIKNYENEIEEFFAFIEPWAEDDFLGYARYEEAREPELFYKKHKT